MLSQFQFRASTMSLVAVLAACAGHASAVVVPITTNTTINPGDTTIGNPAVPLADAEIEVRGATLTINRDDAISIMSLSLVTNAGTGATLTHTQGNRIDLNVAGSVSVDANSRILADARGFLGSNGPGAGESANGFNGGGAGYGGAGGDANGSSQAVTTLSGLGGVCYGFDQASLFAPTSLGSGGGNVWSGGFQQPNTGGVGGGSVRLGVGGAMILNGQILARGGSGQSASSRRGGGGSGGSVYITSASIAGEGLIDASGGVSINDFGYGGGGGGGRIAVITGSSNLDGIATVVSGGAGAVRGGAGTVYLRFGNALRGTLIVDNNNATRGENTEFYGPLSLDCNLVVRNNGSLGPAHGQTDFDLNILGNVFIDGTGFVSADARGRRGSAGPGAGQSAEGFNGGGGGYGGAGGDASGSSQAVATLSGLGGVCYAFDQSSLFAPVSLGSGGGNVWSSGVQQAGTGGFGGGSIRLNVAGLLTIDGLISSRGGDGASASSRRGGGGSGGSIRLSSATLAGSGVINASGGTSVNDFGFGGGGGGGRVALSTGAPSLDAITIVASGGSGAVRGGAGTIFVRLANAARGTLFIDNNNASPGENTEFYGPLTLDCNLVIRNNGTLGPAHGQTDFDLQILGDTNIESSGAINADARGSRGSTGLGAGRSADGLNGGGAGHGGLGGNGFGHNASGGATFGSMVFANGMQLGSGGGNVWSGGTPDRGTGGFGGGQMKLETRGTLTLNGRILARGGSGQSASSRRGGGGSGGSAFLVANAINGSGTIDASGGTSVNDFGFGGGGGGGRVLVVTCLPSTPTINVAGGAGAQSGQPGTAVVRQPGILVQPANFSTCTGGSASMSIYAVGRGPVTYQWRRNNVAINPATNPSAATPTLQLPSITPDDIGSYTCFVATGCGTFLSDPALLSVCAACDCPADYDQDGGVTGADIAAFFADFESGLPCADVDLDGGVTGADVGSFFAVFEAGGC